MRRRERLGIVGVASYLGTGIHDVVSGLLIARGTAGADSMPVYDFGAGRGIAPTDG